VDSNGQHRYDAHEENNGEENIFGMLATFRRDDQYPFFVTADELCMVENLTQ
jgi:hypothetical protein